MQTVQSHTVDTVVLSQPKAVTKQSMTITGLQRLRTTHAHGLLVHVSTATKCFTTSEQPAMQPRLSEDVVG